MDFNSIRDILPKGGELVEPSSLEFLYVDEFQKMSLEEQVNYKHVLLNRGIDWVYIAGKNIYSGRGNLIDRYSEGKTQSGIFSYTVKDNKLKLIGTTQVIKPVGKVKEEKRNMENNLNGQTQADSNRVAELLGQFGINGGVNPVAPASAAPNTTASASNSFNAPATNNANTVVGQKVLYQVKVINFNRKHGGVVGYVTQNGRTISKSVSKTYKMEGDLPALRVDDKVIRDQVYKAWSEHKGKGAEVNTLLSQHGLPVKKLALRDVAAGKPKGIVLAVPEGGLFSVSEFRTPQLLTPDESKTNLVYKLLDFETGLYQIQLLFGNLATELISPDGKSDAVGQYKLQVTTKTRKVKDKKSDTYREVDYPAVKVAGRKNLVHEYNYFPLNVFPSTPVTELSEEQSKLINKHWFGKMFQGSTPQEVLVSEQEDLFVKKDDTYICRWLTADNNLYENPHIKAYYNSEEILPTYDVPEVELFESKTSHEMKTRILKDNVLVQKDDPRLGKHSLSDERYSKFIEESHGAVTLESLRTIARRGKGPKNAFDEISENMNFYKHIASSEALNDKLEAGLNLFY